MSTTLLLVEYLFAGTLFLASLLLLAAGVGCDLSLLMALRKFGDVNLSLMLAAVAYPLGVMVDELSEKSLRFWEHRLRRDFPREKSVQSLLSRGPRDFFIKLMEHKRSRIRLIRSFAFNLGFAALSLFVGSLFAERFDFADAIPWLTAISLLLSCALWVWRGFQLGWIKSLRIEWESLPAKPMSGEAP
jgi:hypothetical protein